MRNTRAYAQDVFAGVSLKERVADFWELSKPGITSLVLIAAAAGYYVGSRDGFDLQGFLLTVAGVGLVAAGAGALNEYLERGLDARMKRTRSRPLASGRVPSRHGLIYGISAGALGTLILLAGVNLLTAALTASTLLLYVFAYTPLKRKSTLNTLVGGLPGAAPPLLGWAGARGTIGVEGLVLFALLFFWQMPHFLSIAWMCREDYEAAGFKMLSVQDTEGKATARHILLNAAALLPVSLLPTMAGISGGTYFVFAAATGLGFFALSALFAVTKSQMHAKRVFFGSLLHLPMLLVVMVLDKVV